MYKRSAVILGSVVISVVYCVLAIGGEASASSIDEIPAMILTDSIYVEPVAEAHMGGVSFFTHNTLPYGIEPWVTDGTVEGTHILRDIRVGPGGSGSGGFISCGNFVYFKVVSIFGSLQLWRTDGTEEGTELVSRFNTSSGRIIHLLDLSVSGDNLYMTMRVTGTAPNHWEMWALGAGGAQPLGARSFLAVALLGAFLVLGALPSLLKGPRVIEPISRG